MAEPTCPKCAVSGLHHIVSDSSQEISEAGDPWFEVAYCDSCGHVYGVFTKHTISSSPRPSTHNPTSRQDDD